MTDAFFDSNSSTKNETKSWRILSHQRNSPRDFTLDEFCQPEKKPKGAGPLEPPPNFARATIIFRKS